MKNASGGSQYSTYGKSHYQRNKQKYLNQVSARRLRNRKHVRAIKETGSCVDCGIRDWRVLDFDHLPGVEKCFEISDSIGRGLSLKKIDSEIAKCELVCANCHRIRTVIRAGIV